jgi:hypothetical protein
VVSGGGEKSLHNSIILDHFHTGIRLNMSELSLQVQSLKSQSLAAASIYNGTPSLFLNKSEAGHIDIDDVLEGAVSAINTLAQYDRRFPFFLENLFHPSSQYVQRELHTPEVKASN